MWAQDEARLGLIPIVRRVWAPRGQRPRAIGRRRYQWLYVYAFVEPSTGATQWLLLPTVSTPAFSIALEAFARAIGAGASRRVLLVVDGAGWHKANDLRIPDGIQLVFLPAYSPELQPAERLWPLLHEALANRLIDSLDELEDILVRRCRFLFTNTDLMKANTNFHWWPSTNPIV